MKVAYVLINCDLGFEKDVIENLKEFESVNEVHGTYGAYDLITKVENIDQDKLRETIIWKIRKIPRVRSTLTLMGIEGQN